MAMDDGDGRMSDDQHHFLASFFIFTCCTLARGQKKGQVPKSIIIKINQSVNGYYSTKMRFKFQSRAL